MAIQKYLARDFSFYVSDDNEATWKTISGLSEWSWNIDSNEEDVSDIDNGER